MSTNDDKVARRYARALFELCAPLNASGSDLESTKQALEVFAQLWAQHAEFREAILNPAIPLTQRLQAVQAKANLVAPNDKVFANFVAVLLENGRLAMIAVVNREFARMVEAFQRVLALEVTSAVSLSENERKVIQAEIQSKAPAQYGPHVSIDWRVDPEILGGFRIKVGDKLLDSSIRGSLDRIQRDLSTISNSALGQAGASAT